ncbi:MAG: alpha-1-antitrypsin, partial [Pirellulaceae bacterium]|nr:alpha-1-antitrypsin [Pirellulaceae bacterium]
MSVLAPLYFLGALAIGLPILFHLIRRRPKGEVEFSSLMFLSQTPPRLTKRSRLENWPLLLMRALALLLLAAAFARPFIRSAAFSDSDLAGRRLMMLIDTSASMQRDGLW